MVAKEEQALRKRPPEELESVKAVLNCLADSVETVTPYLVAEILKNDKHGVEIAWLPPVFVSCVVLVWVVLVSGPISL